MAVRRRGRLAAATATAECVQVLLAAGADVNAVESRTGVTPLHYAALTGTKQVIKLLLAAGAHTEVEAGREIGGRRRPLHLAAKTGRPAGVALLLDAGADPSAVDEVRVAPSACWLRRMLPSPRGWAAAGGQLFSRA